MLSKILLIVLCTFLMLIVMAYIVSIGDEQAGNYELVILTNGVPIALFAIFLFCASRNKIFAECLGPSLYGTYAIALSVAYTLGILDEIDGFMRSYFLGQAVIYYLLYLGTQQTRFLRHFIVRNMINIPCLFIISLVRVNHRELLLWQALYLQGFGIVVTELVFFMQSRSKAKLFLALKITIFQQQQLFNLLDSVPDKVMIVAKETEDHYGKAVYTNRQMKEFFGGDPTAPMMKQSSQQMKRRGAKTHPMKSKIFESMQTDSAVEERHGDSYAENLFSDTNI